MGGVLRQLNGLAAALSAKGHSISAAAMYPSDGDWKHIWNNDSIQLRTLFPRKTYKDIPGPLTLIKAVSRLRRIALNEKPDVLYSFSGNAAMLVSSLVCRTLSGTKLVFGIRGSGQHLKIKSGDLKYKASLEVIGWISPAVPLAISNSEAGFGFRHRVGHRFGKEIIIHNGIDTMQFQPDPEARNSLRREWGVTDGEILIGAAGRIVPAKGFHYFITAASAVRKSRPAARFVIIGGGQETYRRELDQLGHRSGLDRSLIWAGPRKDMRGVYSALDLLCLSSYAEGFPNVVAEAMACGVPCVVTDAGDSAAIVGNLGIVVPTGDPNRLADGLTEALDRLRCFNPAALRNRIVSEFSIEKMTLSTEAALTELLGR